MARGATTLTRLGIALSIFVSSLLAGCGQTGPLYLPEDSQPETQEESQEDQATQEAPAE